MVFVFSTLRVFFVLACMPTRVNNDGGSVECEKERIFPLVAFTNK